MLKNKKESGLLHILDYPNIWSLKIRCTFLQDILAYVP